MGMLSVAHTQEALECVCVYVLCTHKRCCVCDLRCCVCHIMSLTQEALECVCMCCAHLVRDKVVCARDNSVTNQEVLCM